MFLCFFFFFCFSHSSAFLTELMDACLVEARKTDGKMPRVTLNVLKEVIRNNDKFDFLRGLIAEEGAAAADGNDNDADNGEKDEEERPAKRAAH